MKDDRGATQEIRVKDARASMRSPSKKRRREVNSQYLPVLILAGLGALCIVGLIVLQFAPDPSSTVENTLAAALVATVGAIAGLVRPVSGGGDGS